MNNYEYSWKAAVLTKNTLYKNWDLSLFWHGLTALAGFCMNSSYMSAYVYLESKGITQIEGEMKKSSNFHAWSRQTNGLRKIHQTQFKFYDLNYVLNTSWFAGMIR